MTTGRDVVRYLKRADRFLDAGGCEHCGTLIMGIGAGLDCRCGVARMRDPTWRLRRREAFPAEGLRDWLAVRLGLVVGGFPI